MGKGKSAPAYYLRRNHIRFARATVRSRVRGNRLKKFAREIRRDGSDATKSARTYYLGSEWVIFERAMLCNRKPRWGLRKISGSMEVDAIHQPRGRRSEGGSRVPLLFRSGIRRFRVAIRA